MRNSSCIYSSKPWHGGVGPMSSPCPQIEKNPVFFTNIMLLFKCPRHVFDWLKIAIWPHHHRPVLVTTVR